MKQFLVASLFACLATTAVAQPEEIQTDNVISMVVGQEKVVTFSKDVSEVRILNDGIVKALTYTNRTMILTAVGPGETNVFFYGDGNDGERYRTRVIVGPAMHADTTPGHVVRIYGWAPPQREAQRGGLAININNAGNQNAGASKGQPDFIARYCSETGCGEPMPTAAEIAAGAAQDRTTK